MRLHVLLVLLLALFFKNAPLLGQTPVDAPSIDSASTRLAVEFTRMARTAMMSEPLTTSAISTAVILIKESMELDPTNPSIARAAIEVAQMADLLDLERESIHKLLALTPSSTTSQLARLRDAIEVTNTADSRIAVYEQLLSDGNSATLDSRVASRLALDIALLQRQLGDIEQFARWLAESVSLDPSYPDAISLATGFFGDETADIYTRAELLSATMLANIRDITSQVSLAEFLMSYGDYEDAEEVYGLVLGEKKDDELTDGLLADIALSQWASGKDELALKTIATRQTYLDIQYRMQTRRQQPRLTPLEVARIHAPLMPKLATLRSAIYAWSGNEDMAEQSLDSATGSMLILSEMVDSRDGYWLKAAEFKLQAAWVALWLSEDVALAEKLIAEVEANIRIDSIKKTRFDGWISLRKGEYEEAISTLSTLRSDASAKAGVALANLLLGNKQASATQFLEIAKSHGGTIIGVWSRKQLEKLVGTTFDIRPEIKNLHELMSSVLDTTHSIVADPRSAIDVQVSMSTTTFAPYEPITLFVTITNNTPIPMTIAKNGPIQPLLLIEGLLEIPNVNLGTAPPMLIPIDHELSLLPKEKITTSVNLRTFWPGAVLNGVPLRGGALRLSVTTNFVAKAITTQTGQNLLVYENGPLGATGNLRNLRIDGIRPTDEWVTNALTQTETIDSIDGVTTLVLLSWLVKPEATITVVPPLIPPPPSETPQLSDEEIVNNLKTKAITAILSRFPSLDPVSQAWMLITMSSDDSIEAVTGMMKEPEGKIAKIAQLVRLVSTIGGVEALENAHLRSAMDSSDADVKTIANWAHNSIKKAFEVEESADQ